MKDSANRTNTHVHVYLAHAQLFSNHGFVVRMERIDVLSELEFRSTNGTY